MKASTGLLFFGLLFGAVGALVIVKMRRGESGGSLDALADRIQDSLSELEARLAKA